MKATTKFNVKDLAANGEWDEDNKLLIINQLGGELGIEGKFLGFAVNTRGTMEAGLDNRIRVKVHSIGNLPGFLIPGILTLFKKFGQRFAGAVSVQKDLLLINPNQLLPDNSGIRVLIQPEKLEISEEVAGSLQERIRAWMDQYAGTTAKEIVAIILAIPDVLALLARLAKDPRIPGELKLKIGLGIAYIISPVDLIPEIMAGPLGLVDDVVALGLLLSNLVSEIPPELIRDNWQGQPEVLEMIIQGHAWMGVMSKLPEGVLKKLVALFGKTTGEAAAGKTTD